MRRERTEREDLLVLILTSMAVLATAWCGFQASIWSGRQAFGLNDVSNVRRQASQERIEGDQMINMDVSEFLDWVDARFNGETNRADFLLQRFRPGLRGAVNDWIATAGTDDPLPPGHPFALPAYTVPPWHKADALEQQALGVELEARTANFNSDKYMLATVLMAAVLFFASSGPKLATPALQRTFLALATSALVAALIFTALQPVAFSSRPTLPSGGEPGSTAF